MRFPRKSRRGGGRFYSIVPALSDGKEREKKKHVTVARKILRREKKKHLIH